MTDGISWILKINFFSFYVKITGNIGSVALSKYRHCEFCTSCTLQSGESHNFTFMYFTGNLVIYNFFRIKRMMNSPVLYLQHNLFTDIMFSDRITVFHRTSNHSFNDSVFTEVIYTLCQSLNGASIPDNGTAVCTIDDFIQFMSNDNRSQSIFLKFHQKIKKHLCIFIIQGRSRFIQDQKFYFL